MLRGMLTGVRYFKRWSYPHLRSRPPTISKAPKSSLEILKMTVGLKASSESALVAGKLIYRTGELYVSVQVQTDF